VPKPPSCHGCISARWDLFTGATYTTMSVDPGVLDANVLAYAVNVDAPQHAASRVLEAASDPLVKLYVTSQILCELYSIVTNPRRVAVVSAPPKHQASFGYPGASWFTVVANPGPCGCEMDATVAASPRHRRERIRFANRRHHASEWFKRTRRTCGRLCTAIAAGPYRLPTRVWFD
jgi:hypothetical protein